MIAEIINNPVSFKPKIVEGISTNFDEYLPIISPDQETAFFTRRSDKKTMSSIIATTVEEFTMSQKKCGKFTKGTALDHPFNLQGNEGAGSITINNKSKISKKLINKHFTRKHGKKSYYGQR